ncbi:hypothetical protein [Halomonas organivorans]|uniref:Spy/CpxP family protein refolding chaperone n=1 Tax=Halomonas organivorans TaxID=257772 RepID=A0A7W5BVJ5_9GAMM|nr:hypothetical protein [Halomonas organivorans]MBB3139942.1 Spy/CpxP family protein refolding chaperone [Halomonas organivorans]
MPRCRLRRHALGAILVAAFSSPAAFAHGGADYGPGMGPGMMGGYGHGMGPGMMGGYGPGMGPDTWSLFNEDQRQRARALMDDFHQRQCEHGGEMMVLQQDLMTQLYADEKRDPQALADTQSRLAELQRQMWQEHRQLQQSLFELLDEEQRRRLAPRPTQ